jgi:hypothetical protein
MSTNAFSSHVHVIPQAPKLKRPCSFCHRSTWCIPVLECIPALSACRHVLLSACVCCVRLARVEPFHKEATMTRRSRRASVLMVPTTVEDMLAHDIEIFHKKMETGTIDQ